MPNWGSGSDMDSFAEGSEGIREGVGEVGVVADLVVEGLVVAGGAGGWVRGWRAPLFALAHVSLGLLSQSAEGGRAQNASPIRTKRP
jgi:hypothetical protein